MDQSRAAVLEALEQFRRSGDVVFGRPGHEQGRAPGGMLSPDAADASLKTLRVVAE